MTKNVQQMRTTFPIGRSDDSRVITTNLRPGARLITLCTNKTLPKLLMIEALNLTNLLEKLNLTQLYNIDCIYTFSCETCDLRNYA